MVHSHRFRRLLAAALIVCGVSFPAVEAFGDEGSTGAVADSPGVLSQALDWLLELVTGTAADENDEDGDGGAEVDPSG